MIVSASFGPAGGTSRCPGLSDRGSDRGGGRGRGSRARPTAGVRDAGRRRPGP
jgi:hypothetical protein